MKKLMVIAALLVFMAGSAAYAADWNFYGSARVSTFYTDWDNDMLRAGNPITGVGADTTNFEQDLNGNARIGARVKVSDELSGRFEYGAKGGDVNLRLLWGEWDFGPGSLGVGQHYTPLLMPYSNQVYNIYAMEDGDTNMSLFGMLYGKREPMVRLKFGGFQIAAVAPRELVYAYYTFDGAGAGVMASQPNTEIRIPNIQAKYKFDFDWGHINLAAGYQSFDVVDSGQHFDVESYVLALGGRVNAGKAYFKGNIWGGQNVGNLADIFVSSQVFSTLSGAGSRTKDGAGVGFARWSDGTLNAVAGASHPERGITDNDALAGLLVAGYEIRRGLYIEAGYGYTRTELDTDGASKDDCHVWYLQSTVFLTEGVFLTPEIGALDGEDDMLEVFYAGVKWQINF